MGRATEWSRAQAVLQNLLASGGQEMLGIAQVFREPRHWPLL
jgi:hypothetical protein